MDAFRFKKTPIDILKDIVYGILLAAMWLGMIIMLIVL